MTEPKYAQHTLQTGELPINENEQQIGPWRRQSSETVYDNPWIRVHHERVITPAGTPGIYGRVHFKSVAVGIVPIDAQGNTYLVGQYRYALDSYSWEIPMGGCPLNDEGGYCEADVLATAQRELREETGLEASDWQTLLKLHTTNSVSDEVGYLYIAKGLSEGIAQPEETEDISVKKLPLEAAIAMALDGRITDALSVAALLRLALLEKTR